MTGLEKIIQKIIEDAEQKANQIIERAEEYVKEQEAETDKQRSVLIARAVAQGKRDAEVLEVRMNSLAEASARKANLEQRREAVSEAINQAITLLSQKSDAEKLALYTDLVKNSRLKEGRIQVAGEETHLLDQLIERVGDNFRADNQAADIRGGVIIKTNEITENLSYDLVIRNYLPELSALASSYLFEREQY